MNILICDDLPEECAAIDRLIRESGFEAETAVFQSASGVLDYARSGGFFDVCILDIVMPGMNGIYLAKQLRGDGYTGYIVLLSTSRQYGPESYEVGAFSYLLKPPTAKSVKKLLSDIKKAREETDSASILLKIQGMAKSVLLRDISYIEVILRNVHFHMRDGGVITVYATFVDISAELLRDPRFVQCHRSYLVNMEDIATITEKEIVMRSGAVIAITRTYKDARRKYFKWVMSRP